MELTVHDYVEAEALRTALATCFHLASGEERALRDKIALGGLDAEEHRVAEWGMTDAARRRMRYSLLHDRALNLVDQFRSAEVIEFPTPAEQRATAGKQE